MHRSRAAIARRTASMRIHRDIHALATCIWTSRAPRADRATPIAKRHACRRSSPGTHSWILVRGCARWIDAQRSGVPESWWRTCRYACSASTRGKRRCGDQDSVRSWSWRTARRSAVACVRTAACHSHMPAAWHPGQKIGSTDSGGIRSGIRRRGDWRLACVRGRLRRRGVPAGAVTAISSIAVDRGPVRSVRICSFARQICGDVDLVEKARRERTHTTNEDRRQPCAAGHHSLNCSAVC